MSDQGDDEAQRDAETGEGNLANRLRSTGGLSSDSEDSEEREAVDRLSDRLRDTSSGAPSSEETASPTTGSSETHDEASEDTSDNFEDVLLEALDSDGTDPAPPSKGEPEPETDVESRGLSSSETDQQTLDDSGGAAPRQGESHTSAGHDRECPSCQASNPEDTRFCVQCGERLDPGENISTGSSDVRVPEPSSEGRAPEDAVPEGIELICIRDDGSDGKSISIQSDTTLIGRDGDERFPTDEFLNPRHAELLVEDDQLYVKDLDSLNGTFIKIRGEVRLEPGDTFLMGRQVLRFEEIEEDFEDDKTTSDGTRYMGSPPPEGDYKVLQLGTGDLVQDIYCLPESGVVLGREKGDIIFPRDKFMSGRHARIVTDEICHLVDLNSSNGTWIKLWDKTQLEDDDYLFMGQQLFRVERNASR